MSIKVKESIMVYPADETPRETLWLSKLDMMIRQPFSHTNVFFIYHPPNSNYDSQKKSSPRVFFDSNILKEALSRALVPFYPMAGRLKFNDETRRFEIDCNAKGALFIEAEATQALAEFGDYSNTDSELRKLVFPTCDYSEGVSSFPLLLVQLTRFDCGGVCLGFAQHHHVGDGPSHMHFINSWARLAKGLDLSVQPIHERASYLAPRHPPQVKFQHLEYEPPLPPLVPSSLSGEIINTTESMFKLTKDQVATLKLHATSQEAPSYKLSTFAIEAAHVWRTACRARGLADDQDVNLYISVNGRSRLKDVTLPQGYCGNIIFFALCKEKAGDVMSKPLWYSASKVHEAVKKMDDIEYLRSAIDFVELQPDITPLIRGPHTSNCPNLTIISWARLAFHDADFGWDRPHFTGINGIKYDGLTYITPSSNGDGSSSVGIKLFTPHMALFNEYFYDL